jgi:hypothetical protein
MLQEKSGAHQGVPAKKLITGFCSILARHQFGGFTCRQS